MGLLVRIGVLVSKHLEAVLAAPRGFQMFLGCDCNQLDRMDAAPDFYRTLVTSVENV